MEGVDIACLNSPHETVLAGGVGIIANLEFRLRERGIRTKQLVVPYAFHSAQLDPILGAFGDAIKQVTFERLQVPIISPVTGQLEERIGADYLLRQARQTVQFSPVLERVKGSGALNDRTIFLEIGPHPICSEMIKATLGRDTCTLPTLRRNEDSWAVLVQSLAALHDKGLSVNWGEYYREYEKAHRLLALPSYAFDNSSYWIDYRNDWSLRKGDPPETTINPEKCTKLSYYLHRVVKDEYDGTQATVVYETDLQDEKVHAAISGHRVNGCALCPSSLYATVALDVADHQQNRMKSAQIPLNGRNITHMEVSHPLIVGSLEDEKRVLRTTVELAERHSNIIRVRFSTVASELKETQHACCFLELGKQEDWLSEWAENAYMVQKHLATLDALAALGNSSKITRKLAYRLFRSLVDYAPKYQLMDQVALANSGVEASCKVQLQGENGPHWIDALAHISGFALNANEDTESADFVYISQGWGAMRLGKQLQAGRTYQTYVNMWPQKNGLMDGNVWILSDNAVVGLIEDIQFQKIKRQALNLLLLAPGSSRESANLASPSAMKESAQQQPHLGLPEGRVKPDTKTQDSYRQLVAEELGLPASQLSDNGHLLNLGLDSLMSLTLTSRLQDEWGIEVSHQCLLECVTIGELLAILDNVTGTGHGGSCQGPDIPQDPTAKCCANGPTRSTDSWTQTGSASENINKPFTESEFSFGEAHFSSAQGVALTGDYISDVDPPSGLLFESADSMHKPSESSRIDSEIDSHEPSAKVILLQRRSNLSSNKQLFLFPDGSGSPASYAQFENLSPDFEVYGLFCPYLKIPQAETNGLAATVGIYISAIRENQPHGPYHLGGWSIGGVYAYEASNRLVQMREHVALLLLIDSPCPSIFPPMNSRLIKFFEALGVFDQMPSDIRGRSPLSKREQVLNHFKIATEDLSDYKPVRAMAGEAAPKVFVFWARNGVCEEQASVRDDGSSTDSAYALDNWILAKRTDFGPCGWEALLPVERMVMRVIPGNHFTMMQSPNIAQISKEIQEILRLL
ncbi:polyketide synthase [Aspergillus melleus]|uniref:polyketide synthase n=1 Tax=Aspergillus melleus TaxID=138277 RepID=UPI001E8CF77C|nr:polyketide synthase [Aspergillus melleus]KAH8423424.1 polyketide synthase [Aspergillus melleus]